jgi:hypothetical protein
LGPRHRFIASRHGELKFATHVIGVNAVKNPIALLEPLSKEIRSHFGVRLAKILYPILVIRNNMDSTLRLAFTVESGISLTAKRDFTGLCLQHISS